MKYGGRLMERTRQGETGVEEHLESGLTYRNAGVDIDLGAELVTRIKPLAAATKRPGSTPDLGGFGAFFDLRAAGFTDPILVAATDGVGTKLKLAAVCADHDTVGIDLVAMCVNDLIVQGAEPLFFLDYYAAGRIEIEAARAVVAGIADGCKQAGCALIGGETAEMPGVYGVGDYDLAGFAVGAVERDRALTGAAIAAGDVVLGLASSGLHSNGFSLVRKVIADSGAQLEAPAPFAPKRSLGSALLTPTRIYVKSGLALHRAGLVKGLAHITGGGLIENLPRILPSGTTAHIAAAAWELPGVFSWLMEVGGIAADEMLRTFNCGIGMVAVVAPEDAEAALRCLENTGETVFRVGEITPRATDAPAILFDGGGPPWAPVSPDREGRN